MYRKLALITTIVCCAALSVAAQDKAALASAKVKLLKQAINFYSNDTALSATPVSCDATDMRSLKDCIKKMPKVEAKVDKWDKMPLANAEDLRALARTIKSDVVANREYRKTYAQYPTFLKNVAGIVADVPAPHVDTASAAQPVAAAPATATDSVASQNPPPATVSAPAPVITADTTVQESKSSNSELPEGLNVWNIAAIVLALLALIKSFIPKKQKEIYREERQIVAEPVPVKKPDNDVMNAKLGAVISEVEELNRMVLEIDARVQRRLDDMKHGNTGL